MSHHLDEVFQSAYKNFHSTETALVKVQNDILCAMDNNESVILLLLDLSAAFNTVDHSILLSRLQDRFGVKGTVLAWFKSYLTSRKQFVQVNDCNSTQHSLERGLPQGSVLGPLLYVLYASPIADIIQSSTSYGIISTLMIPSCIYLLKLTVAMISHWPSVVLNAVSMIPPTGLAQLVECRTTMREVVGSTLRVFK